MFSPLVDEPMKLRSLRRDKNLCSNDENMRKLSRFLIWCKDNTSNSVFYQFNLQTLHHTETHSIPPQTTSSALLEHDSKDKKSARKFQLELRSSRNAGILRPKSTQRELFYAVTYKFLNVLIFISSLFQRYNEKVKWPLHRPCKV